MLLQPVFIESSLAVWATFLCWGFDAIFFELRRSCHRIVVSILREVGRDIVLIINGRLNFLSLLGIWCWRTHSEAESLATNPFGCCVLGGHVWRYILRSRGCFISWVQAAIHHRLLVQRLDAILELKVRRCAT